MKIKVLKFMHGKMASIYIFINDKYILLIVD